MRRALLAAVMGVPLVAYFTQTLRAFYVQGAMWGDAGTIAFVMWHNGLLLKGPLGWGGESYLPTHMALVFWITSGLSWLLPLSCVQFFALYCGVVQAVMALAVYVVLPKERAWQQAGAAVLAIAFAFNGIALAAARNPHFELLIPAAGALFLAGLARGWPVVAWMAFVLCLMTREDAGLDLFFVLAAVALALRLQGVALAKLRAVMGFALVALGYALVILVVQHRFCPGGHALKGVFLGDRPFAGITPLVLAGRLTFYLIYRLYVVLPIAVAVGLALRWRDPQFIAGYVGCLPWAVLSFLAVSPYAGTLSSYYAFPFIFGMFWPLAGGALARRLDVGGPGWRYVAGFGLMLGASFVGVAGQQNPQDVEYPQSFFLMPSFAAQARTDAALGTLRRENLGRVAVTGGVMALDPDHYTFGQLVWGAQSPLPDTVIFFPRGQDTGLALGWARQAKLPHEYQVAGTALQIATDRVLDLPLAQ